MGVALLRSTSILPILTLPAYSPASSSTMGAMARHGPHQAAQKSTNTGVSDFSTSLSKFASVTSIIPFAAIGPHSSSILYGATILAPHIGCNRDGKVAATQVGEERSLRLFHFNDFMTLPFESLFRPGCGLCNNRVGVPHSRLHHGDQGWVTAVSNGDERVSAQALVLCSLHRRTAEF